MRDRQRKAAYYYGDKTFAVSDGESIRPAPGEVRLDVAYCGICGTDVHIYHGAMDQRVEIPQVIGHEMSGTIAALGDGVQGFEVGDRVVVRPLDSRGETPADKGVSHICAKLKFLGIDTPGAFQSSWTVPAFTLHKLPKDIDMRLAALVEPLSVACHDVRLGEIADGETAVVIGGGPIGMLIGLVARQAGARVILSEVNPYRLKLAEELGLMAVNPTETDVVSFVHEHTEDAGADAVFEVSGSAAGAEIMTELACIRGRIIMVAIHSEPKKVNLFRFFWRELRMIGVRVYEPQDYDQAITLVESDVLPLERLITGVEPLERLQGVFKEMESNPETMKVLIDCAH